MQIKTPSFNILVTLHLDKGHNQTINRHSGPDTFATANLFSGVNSSASLILSYITLIFSGLVCSYRKHYENSIILHNGNSCSKITVRIRVKVIITKMNVEML